MKLRMVDQILDWQLNRSIRGVKAVSFEEYCAKEAFGDEPQLPQTLLLQCLFDLANWLVILSSDFARMARPVGFDDAVFHRPLGPSQRLEMELTLREQSPGAMVFDGVGGGVGWTPPTIRANGGRCPPYDAVVELRGAVLMPDALDLYHNPADLRVLFSEIHRPFPAEAQ